MILMMVGDVPFMSGDLEGFKKLEKTNEWRIASQDRLENRPAKQWMGPDDVDIEVSGVLVAQLGHTGTLLANLIAQGDRGDSYMVTTGDGRAFGMFYIKKVEQTGEYFNDDGTCNKIEFTIKLTDDPDETGASSASFGG